VTDLGHPLVKTGQKASKHTKAHKRTNSMTINALRRNLLLFRKLQNGPLMFPGFKSLHRYSKRLYRDVGESGDEYILSLLVATANLSPSSRST
jgi:ABC-type polysaccharide transport system permease subunit